MVVEWKKKMKGLCCLGEETRDESQLRQLDLLLPILLPLMWCDRDLASYYVVVLAGRAVEAGSRC